MFVAAIVAVAAVGYFAGDNACIFSLLSSELVAVFASFVIAVSPTRHFSYSSGNRSSMYFLMLVLA
jgi:hypothetical protein